MQDLQKRFTVSASKALGQNFLVDANISRKIAESIEANQNVIEVGPGIGSLTVPLARHSSKVFAIEFDQHIIDPLKDVLEQFDVADQVEIIHSDVMEVDLEKLCVENHISTIIGNLPYNISAPLLADIARKVPSAQTVVAMVQKEVGERLAADQGTRSVSSITLKCQYFMDIELLFNVSSQSFIPRPRVDSLVLIMRRRASQKFDLNTNEVNEMFTLMDSAFSQRRKMLRQSLKAAFGVNLDRIFNESGVDPTRRPEACTIEDFVKLFEAYRDSKV